MLRLQYILIFIDWSESDILLNINTNTALHLASAVLNMALPIIPGPPYTPFTTVLCLLHFKLSQTIRLISLRVFRHVDLQFVSFCKLFFNSSHFSSCWFWWFFVSFPSLHFHKWIQSFIPLYVTPNIKTTCNLWLYNLIILSTIIFFILFHRGLYHNCS